VSLEANKALARRVWEDVFNHRNLAAAEELVAPDAVNHEAPEGVPQRGPESLIAAVSWLTSAFPDLHVALEDIIAEGDKVVVQLTLSGTHRGPFMGMAPTHRRFAQRQIHIVRIQDGKIRENWALRDDMTMLRQLGFGNAPPAASVGT
jgi:steroid delta-isomerase-like uncharacterized protein